MKARRPSFTRECKLSTTNYQLIGGIARMDKDEIEQKAKEALAAAGDMASRGAEWARNYRD